MDRKVTVWRVVAAIAAAIAVIAIETEIILTADVRWPHARWFVNHAEHVLVGGSLALIWLLSSLRTGFTVRGRQIRIGYVTPFVLGVGFAVAALVFPNTMHRWMPELRTSYLLVFVPAYIIVFSIPAVVCLAVGDRWQQQIDLMDAASRLIENAIGKGADRITLTPLPNRRRPQDVNLVVTIHVGDRTRRFGIVEWWQRESMLNCMKEIARGDAPKRFPISADGVVVRVDNRSYRLSFESHETDHGEATTIHIAPAHDHEP